MNLTPTEDARRLNTPPLQGRGRGWGLSADHLVMLHERAAQMRHNPTEPEKRLWRRLSNGQLGGHKFRRQSVIAPFIADFLCPRQKLIVEVDGDTHDETKDRLRDDLLEGRGYRIMRVTNSDVMTNMDGVLRLVASVLAETTGCLAAPHPNLKRRGLKDDNAQNH